MTNMEVDKEWYIVEWYIPDSDQPHYSVPHEFIEHAKSILKSKRDLGFTATIYYNAEISIRLDY